MDLIVSSAGSPLTEELALRVAHATSEVTGVQMEEVGIKLVGDGEMRSLNKSYVGADALTDVLSFPREDSRGGDIVISLPEAKRQADAAGWGLEEELTLLSVHGMLHLLGRDHQGEGDKQIMDRETAEILSKLGIEGRAYL